MFLKTDKPWSPEDGDYISQETERKVTFYERYKKKIDFIIYPLVAGIIASLILFGFDNFTKSL